jgi:hypothetical protein
VAPTNPAASYAAPAALAEVLPAQVIRLPPQQAAGAVPDTNTTLPPSRFTAPGVSYSPPSTTDMNHSRAPPYVAPSTNVPVVGQAISYTQGEVDTGFSAPATIIPAQAVVRSIPATALPAAPCTTDSSSIAPRAVYAAPTTSYVGAAAVTTESYVPPATSYSQVPPTVVNVQPTDVAGYAPPATSYLPPVTVPSSSYALPATSYTLAAQSEASEPVIVDYKVPQTNYNGAASS